MGCDQPYLVVLLRNTQQIDYINRNNLSTFLDNKPENHHLRVTYN
jgi:hypothetical protein